MGKIKKTTEVKENKLNKKTKLIKNGLSAPIDDKKTIKHRRKIAESDLTTTLKRTRSKTSKINLILNDFTEENNKTDKELKTKAKKVLKEKAKPLKSTKKRKISKYETLENKYNIKASDVGNAVEGVVTFVQTNPKLKNTLFNEQFPIFLQIVCFKVPKGHSKIIRTVLPNSLLTPESEVCLIVAELKKVSNRDHDKHKEYYEELLSTNNVSGIKQILTFHELRTEYETFELKKRLVDLYDTFLVDGRISGKVVRFCGSIFYKKRKIPTSVKLDAKNLKDHMETALKKTQMHMNLNGDSFMVQIGHSGMTNDQLVENIYALVENLDAEFPGKMDNIRSINVYATRAPPAPIYLSLKSPNDVPVPVNKTKRTRGIRTVTDELSTALNAQVTVRPTGEVLVNAHKFKNIPKKKKSSNGKLEKKTKKIVKKKVPKKK